MNKKGFTVAEVLIALGILSIIFLCTLPVIKHQQINAKEKLFDKAFFVIEKAATELLDDEQLYPRRYFDETSVSFQGKTYEGQNKLCDLLAMKLKVTSEYECGQGMPTNGKSVTNPIVTEDGLEYILPNDSSGVIYVDIDGFDKGANCLKGTDGCKIPDRYSMFITQMGNLTKVNVDEIENLINAGGGSVSLHECDIYNDNRPDYCDYPCLHPDETKRPDYCNVSTNICASAEPPEWCNNKCHPDNPEYLFFKESCTETEPCDLNANPENTLGCSKCGNLNTNRSEDCDNGCNPDYEGVYNAKPYAPCDCVKYRTPAEILNDFKNNNSNMLLTFTYNDASLPGTRGINSLKWFRNSESADIRAYSNQYTGVKDVKINLYRFYVFYNNSKNSDVIVNLWWKGSDDAGQWGRCHAECPDKANAKYKTSSCYYGAQNVVDDGLRHLIRSIFKNLEVYAGFKNLVVPVNREHAGQKVYTVVENIVANQYHDNKQQRREDSGNYKENIVKDLNSNNHKNAREIYFLYDDDGSSDNVYAIKFHVLVDAVITTYFQVLGCSTRE